MGLLETETKVAITIASPCGTTGSREYKLIESKQSNNLEYAVSTM
jgi:hypothetical protein